MIAAVGSKIDVLGRGPPEVVKWDFTCLAEVYVQKEASQRTPLPHACPAGRTCLIVFIIYILFSYLWCVSRSKYNLQGLAFSFYHVGP